MRGQALTELVLGLLVFVTILLFGIHFAEVGYLSVKVQEAQASAVFDATGRRVQRVTGDDSPFGLTLGGPGSVEARAQQAYRDFDGLTSSSNPPVMTKALTRASGMQVNCRREQISWAATPTANAIYRDVGALSCTSQAQLQAIRIPRFFLDQGAGGFFQADHRELAPLPICGLGTATGGACNGRLAILTNDWGLAGDSETGGCLIGSGCENPRYRAAVGSMFVGAGGAAISFARTYAGGNAPDVGNEFWFSYADYSHDFHIQNLGSRQGDVWNTGSPGFGIMPPQTGNNCFLGKPGC